jgi:hypothetical protein
MSTRSNGSLDSEVSITDIRERAINKGFTESQLMECIRVYGEDDVWMVTGQDRSKLRWLRIEDEDE